LSPPAPSSEACGNIHPREGRLDTDFRTNDSRFIANSRLTRPPRPVTTVWRHDNRKKTRSSIGTEKGGSMARFGCGIVVSALGQAASDRLTSPDPPFCCPPTAPDGPPTYIGNSCPQTGKSYCPSSSRTSSFHPLQSVPHVHQVRTCHVQPRCNGTQTARPANCATRPAGIGPSAATHKIARTWRSHP